MDATVNPPETEFEINRTGQKTGVEVDRTGSSENTSEKIGAAFKEKGSLNGISGILRRIFGFMPGNGNGHGPASVESPAGDIDSILSRFESTSSPEVTRSLSPKTARWLIIFSCQRE